jgi:hypothetical protein
MGNNIIVQTATILNFCHPCSNLTHEDFHSVCTIADHHQNDIKENMGFLVILSFFCIITSRSSVNISSINLQFIAFCSFTKLRVSWNFLRCGLFLLLYLFKYFKIWLGLSRKIRVTFLCFQESLPRISKLF